MSEIDYARADTLDVANTPYPAPVTAEMVDAFLKRTSLAKPSTTCSMTLARERMRIGGFADIVMAASASISRAARQE